MNQENLFLLLLIAQLIIGVLAIYWYMRFTGAQENLEVTRRMYGLVSDQRDKYFMLYQETKQDWSPVSRSESIDDILEDIEGLEP